MPTTRVHTKPPSRIVYRNHSILALALLALWLGAPATLAAAEPYLERLPNGMALILIPNSAPTVSVRLLVPAGGRDDPRGLEGLAHYVEHLIVSDPGALGGASNGAPRLRAHGPANAFTSLNSTVYHMELEPRSLGDGLDLLAKRISSLDANAAIALREQSVVRQEYFWRYGNTPRTRLRGQLGMRLGLTHPALGWTIGTPETIARLGLEPARDFWQRHYVPNTMTLVISGAFDRADAREAALASLGAIPTAGAATERVSPGPAATGTPAVALAVTDPEVTDATVEHLAFIDLGALDDATRMRSLAAMHAVSPMLAGGHPSVQGASRAILDADRDARVVNIWLRLPEKRWLELGIYIEASTPAARERLVQAAQSKIAALTADLVPAELLEHCRREGQNTWVLAADAPNADAVVQWLSRGLSLEERAGYRAALLNLTADNVSELVGRLAEPAVTATGEINPVKE